MGKNTLQYDHSWTASP